jgi:Domain of unknown function (DUF3850)
VLPTAPPNRHFEHGRAVDPPPPVHELKIWPDYFEAVRDGRKRFEIRRDDRGFAVGDVLLLREFVPDAGYSGREARHVVTFLTHHEQQPGVVVLGIRPERRPWFEWLRARWKAGALWRT